MGRRKLRWAVVGLPVVALVAAGAVALWPRPSESLLSAENYRSIGYRMSRAEVEAILGPPGDRRTGPTTLAGDQVSTTAWVEHPGQEQRLSVWKDDTATIYVCYSSSGDVSDKWRDRMERLEQNPFADLLWRVKRQWRRWFPG